MTGPAAFLDRAGKERAGLEVIERASSAFTALQPPTEGDVEAVRQALAGWGVTQVVVPDPQGLTPPGATSASTAWALGIMTQAVGRTPEWQEGAWVWTDVRHPSPIRVMSSEDFTSCTSRTVRESAPEVIPDCVYRLSQ